MEKGSAVYLDQLSEELLIEAGLEYTVAVLPKDFKNRIKHIGNLLVQMCFNYKSTDCLLKLELNSITMALSYLLNSSSFDDDEYHAFDKAEIDRKLIRR